MAKKRLTADIVGLVVRQAWRYRDLNQKGQNLYYLGKARVTQLEPDAALVSVTGSDGGTYEVEFGVGEEPLEVYCDCDADEGEPCEHVIAAAYLLQKHLRQNPPVVWQSQLTAAMSSPRGKEAPRRRGGVMLFTVQPGSWGGARVSPYLVPGHSLPEEIPENGPELARFLHEHGLLKDARSVYTRSDYASLQNNTAQVVAVAGVVLGAAYSQDGLFASLAPLLRACPVFSVDSRGNPKSPLTVEGDAVQAVLLSERDGEGVRLRLAFDRGDGSEPVPVANTTIACRKPLWVLAGDALLHVRESPEFVEAFQRHPEITVPEDEVEEFNERYLVPLAERVTLAGEFAPAGEVTADPVKRVYLREEDDEMVAEARFGYAEHEVAYTPDLPVASVARSPEGKLVRVHRDPEFEQEAWKGLSSFGLKRGATPGEFLLRKNTSLVDFLIHHVPQMAEAGYEVFGEDVVTAARVNRSRPTLSLVVSSGIDWFDVQAVVHFGDLDVSWAEMRKAMRRKERYVKLADGSIGAIPPEWMERYRRLFGLLEGDGESVKLSRAQVTLLDELVQDADDTRADEAFAQLRDRLRNVRTIPSQPLPQQFEGALRPYQKAGFDWLHFLHANSFGGCLADDMGTGKTVQTLAFLQSLKESGHLDAPALIVMPRSLLFNWQREAAQFTPELRVAVFANGQRDWSREALGEVDVVLTTYGILLRDVDVLREAGFHQVILDESQAIKNPLSLTARAARRLRCEHRLVLTGTPVENGTMELWSQFAFLNPGLLGSLEYFRKEFAGPIERDHDEGTAGLLRRMVFPFILRRTKEQVAADLPPRTERIVYCEMEPAQETVYARTRDYYRALLLGMIEEGGMDNARMKILEGLLRLRQACNHPALVDPAFTGGSAKMDALLEMLETLRAEGHKALVFSQFTQMLALVRRELEARNIPYEYLDGQTRDRAARVDSFQGDATIPFFLISLKAGGLGLNLTAADYVIHIDPWWNPAVEMQAADRAHRIGQDKPVFIYRFIMRGSVEEKILQLQAAKRDLVAQIIQTDTGLFKSLDREDVRELFS